MRDTRWSGVAVVTLALAVLVAEPPGRAAAVDTDISISTTAIDFGQVDVGSTAQHSVTVTNTGGDPFGPINMFGGAPPTDEYNASQNCQSQTLPAGGSCQVNFSFSPGSTGTFTDTSNFTVSETSSQSDGEDFSVSLTGVGYDPSATTTTATTPTTTTSSTTTTTTPTDTTDHATTQPETTAAATTTSTTAPTVWPLTGAGVVGRPALVVSIGNDAAATQTGLDDADMVFELIVEERRTRFTAVFNSTDPNPVGPVAPAGLADVELIPALNDPAIAYADSTDDVDTALAAGGFEVLTEGVPGFFRHPDRIAPDDLYANLSTLFAQLSTSGAAAPLFEYAPVGTDVGGTPVTFVDVMVGANNVGWTWDARQGLFLRSQLGSPHQLTDGQASADSVVVLVVAYDQDPAGGAPRARSVGSGGAVVYRAGRRIQGSWSRATPTDPFLLTGPNGPILLVPGRTWVELVDADHQLRDG